MDIARKAWPDMRLPGGLADFFTSCVQLQLRLGLCIMVAVYVLSWTVWAVIWYIVYK